MCAGEHKTVGCTEADLGEDKTCTGRVADVPACVAPETTGFGLALSMKGEERVDWAPRTP